MNYLCLDPGLKHTGIAISTDGILAQPITTINAENIGSLISKLEPAISRHKPDIIIVGQPNSGVMVSFAKNLQAELSKRHGSKIILYPEDLSSKILDRIKKVPDPKHHLAAAVILQDYLDSQL